MIYLHIEQFLFSWVGDGHSQHDLSRIFTYAEEAASKYYQSNGMSLPKFFNPSQRLTCEMPVCNYINLCSPPLNENLRVVNNGKVSIGSHDIYHRYFHVAENERIVVCFTSGQFADFLALTRGVKQEFSKPGDRINYLKVLLETSPNDQVSMLNVGGEFVLVGDVDAIHASLGLQYGRVEVKREI